MENDKEKLAILGGGCITLVIALFVAVIFLLSSILDKV